MTNRKNLLSKSCARALDAEVRPSYARANKCDVYHTLVRRHTDARARRGALLATQKTSKKAVKGFARIGRRCKRHGSIGGARGTI
jgi:hypothetical protein